MLKPRYKTENGRPLVRNKNGVYVLDQRVWKAMNATVAAPPASTAQPTEHAPASTSTSTPTTTTTQANVGARVDSIRSALRALGANV